MKLFTKSILMAVCTSVLVSPLAFSQIGYIGVNLGTNVQEEYDSEPMVGAYVGKNIFGDKLALEIGANTAIDSDRENYFYNIHGVYRHFVKEDILLKAKVGYAFVPENYTEDSDLKGVLNYGVGVGKKIGNDYSMELDVSLFQDLEADELNTDSAYVSIGAQRHF